VEDTDHFRKPALDPLREKADPDLQKRKTPGLIRMKEKSLGWGRLRKNVDGLLANGCRLASLW
jgi:hypothetical protein